MARMNVNPTRMELSKLKKRLVTARRGHKLLKDKRDELMKQFLEVVRQNKTLRETVESRLKEIYDSFLIASAISSRQVLESAISFPNKRTTVEVSTRNIMSVNVPIFKVNEDTTTDNKDIFPYGFYGTSIQLDKAMLSLQELLPELLGLAEKEKSAQLLAAEIEKTRRRVNALEYVMIPRLSETIRYITQKLDEIERGNLTRLMKVKDMMVQQQLEANK